MKKVSKSHDEIEKESVEQDKFSGSNEIKAKDIIEIIDRLPEEEREEMTRVIATHYSGPLPMASEFSKYEMTTPGAGSRIIKMAENQSTHRQYIEKHAVSAQFKIAMRAQIFAFLLALVGLLGGFWLIYLGHNATGIATLVGTVGTLVGVYLHGKQTKDE